MLEFLYVLEIIGTIAFALAGAIVGIKKKADIFGVLFLGTTTAVGGGIFRDIILGNSPPNAFKNEIFIIFALCTCIIAFVLMWVFKAWFIKVESRFDKVINVFDAIGLGIFTMNGINIAMEHGNKLLLCIFVGMLTGTGGGAIRDILVVEVPSILKKDIYAVASICGGLFYYILLELHFDKIAAMSLGIVFIFIMRMLATKYKWNLPKIHLD